MRVLTGLLCSLALAANLAHAQAGVPTRRIRRR